jgi:hypothetical protein
MSMWTRKRRASKMCDPGRARLQKLAAMLCQPSVLGLPHQRNTLYFAARWRQLMRRVREPLCQYREPGTQHKTHLSQFNVCSGIVDRQR